MVMEFTLCMSNEQIRCHDVCNINNSCSVRHILIEDAEEWR